VDSKKPIYLFLKWDKIAARLAGTLPYIFLDFDGTLAPIVKNPYAAAIPAATGEILRRLSKSKLCTIAVVSGRALADIKRRINIPGLIYSGNHGFEIKGPGITFKKSLPAGYRPAVKDIKAVLKKKLSGIKGLIIEDKTYSVSVHYRNVREDEIPLVEALFREAVIGHETRGDVRVKPGKMILEIRPALDWDKGRVVLQLLASARSKMRRGAREAVALYIGDDVTDEDAFMALRKRGITVYVGKSENTKASYYLKNTKEVGKLLGMVLEILKGANYERA